MVTREAADTAGDPVYCVFELDPPVMLTLSDDPVAVSAVPEASMLLIHGLVPWFAVTVPDTTQGLVLWVTATVPVIVVEARLTTHGLVLWVTATVPLTLETATVPETGCVA